MSDWKLLSFYTTNTTSPLCLGSTTDLGFANGEPVGVTSSTESDVHAAQEFFCTGSNISSCVAYLNQELQLLGLSSMACNKKGQPDTVSILNRTYDLLRLYQRLFSTRDELENRIQRLNSDCDHQKSCVARANRQQEAMDKALAQETEKLRQLMSRHEVVSAKLKTDKEEIKCLQSVMHHKDLQFKHELKKKEREINRLKDRLHQLLMDKNPDRKIGMDLMHLVQNSDGRRSQWKTGLNKQEEEMYQLLIHNYDVSHQELVLENTELRDCLLVVHQELSALLKFTAESPVISDKEGSDSQDHLLREEDAGDECEGSEASQDSFCELHEGCYQLPYDIIRQEVERGFNKACRKIRLRIKKARKKKSEENDKSKSRVSSASVNDTPPVQLENLKTKIAKYKDIIQQQEHVIKQFLETNSASFLQESHLLHERNMLEKKKKLFLEEKAHFEEERKLFTEAALKLSQERQAVQEERIKFLKEHFLNITPFRKDQTPNRILQKEGGVRLLPPTPNFSPAPDGKIRTPSTEQLFRALGLTDFHRLERSRSSLPHVSRGATESDSPAAFGTAAPTKCGVRKSLFSSASTESELSQKSDSH